MEIVWCIVSAAVGAALAGYVGLKLFVEVARTHAEATVERDRFKLQCGELAAHVRHLARMNKHLRARGPAANVEACKMLGLGPAATALDVQRAFRVLAAKAHPDRGGDAAVFRLVVAVKDAALLEVDRAA